MYAISTDKAPKAIGPYSQGASAGRYVFTAGQIGLDPATGELVDGGAYEQTVRALRSCEAILAGGQVTLADVLKTTVFVTSIDFKDDVDRAFRELFPSPRPARSLVEVAALPRNALVEVECVACR